MSELIAHSWPSNQHNPDLQLFATQSPGSLGSRPWAQVTHAPPATPDGRATTEGSLLAVNSYLALGLGLCALATREELASESSPIASSVCILEYSRAVPSVLFSGPSLDQSFQRFMVVGLAGGLARAFVVVLIYPKGPFLSFSSWLECFRCA